MPQTLHATTLLAQRHAAVWPAEAQRLVAALTATYGPSHERTPQVVTWRNNDPWKETMVYRDGELHNFLRRHRDYVRQTISFYASPAQVAALLDFNGSLLYDRTRGELTAFCGSERFNYVLINLAHDLAAGRLSVAEARQRCASVWRRVRLGWPQPEAQQLLFATDAPTLVVPAADPDREAAML